MNPERRPAAPAHARHRPVILVELLKSVLLTTLAWYSTPSVYCRFDLRGCACFLRPFVYNMKLLLFSVLLLLVQACTAHDRLTALLAAGQYSKAPVVTIVKGSQPKFHLEYLVLRSLGDLPALILEDSGVDYTARYFGKEDFLAMKQMYPLGRLPVLRAFDSEDGAYLAQSGTIVRYLSESCGMFMMSTGPADRARVDFAYETVQELFKAVTAEALSSAEEGDRLLHFRDTSNRGQFSDYEKAAAGLITFEHMLAKTAAEATDAAGEIYLLGNDATYADLALYLKLSELSESDNWPQWRSKGSSGLSLPFLAAFMDTVEARPNVAAFVRSDRRMPRIERKSVDGVADYYFKGDRHTADARTTEEL